VGTSVVSSGSWTDEAQGLCAFDRLAEEAGLFRIVYREVRGELLQPRLRTGDSGVRIDRICVPSTKLEAAGWIHGPIGIEGKRSDMKLGKLFAQAMDYSRSVFEIKRGYHVQLEWVFLWPYEPQTHDLASAMSQHRIGTVHQPNHARLKFSPFYGHNAIQVYSSGALDVKPIPCGGKRGSR
jgi:hypothetical protein